MLLSAILTVENLYLVRCYAYSHRETDNSQHRLTGSFQLMQQAGMVTAGAGETRTGSFFIMYQNFCIMWAQKAVSIVYMYTLTEKFSVLCPSVWQLPQKFILPCPQKLVLANWQGQKFSVSSTAVLVTILCCRCSSVVSTALETEHSAGVKTTTAPASELCLHYIQHDRERKAYRASAATRSSYPVLITSARGALPGKINVLQSIHSRRKVSLLSSKYT